MKQLSKLGISPVPWIARHNGRAGISYVIYNANNISIGIASKSDALMMKAAPKMYEALRELYLLSIDPVGGTKEEREKQSIKYEEALDNARVALAEASRE